MTKKTEQFRNILRNLQKKCDNCERRKSMMIEKTFIDPLSLSKSLFAPQNIDNSGFDDKLQKSKRRNVNLME